MRTITGPIGYLQRVPADQGGGWLVGIMGDTVPYRKTACDMPGYVEGERIGATITDAGTISEVRHVPVNWELFTRTAPRWNCVDYPANGMHYVARDGSCNWCGMTRDQIRAEDANAQVHEHHGSECGGYKCPNCGRTSASPFTCTCGAGRANHVVIIPD